MAVVLIFALILILSIPAGLIVSYVYDPGELRQFPGWVSAKIKFKNPKAKPTE